MNTHDLGVALILDSGDFLHLETLCERREDEWETFPSPKAVIQTRELEKWWDH
jgi:hypothetical protein